MTQSRRALLFLAALLATVAAPQLDSSRLAPGLPDDAQVVDQVLVRSAAGAAISPEQEKRNGGDAPRRIELVSLGCAVLVAALFFRSSSARTQPSRRRLGRLTTPQGSRAPPALI